MDIKANPLQDTKQRIKRINKGLYYVWERSAVGGMNDIK